MKKLTLAMLALILAAPASAQMVGRLDLEFNNTACDNPHSTFKDSWPVVCSHEKLELDLHVYDSPARFFPIHGAMVNHLGSAMPVYGSCIAVKGTHDLTMVGGSMRRKLNHAGALQCNFKTDGPDRYQMWIRLTNGGAPFRKMKPGTGEDLGGWPMLMTHLRVVRDDLGIIRDCEYCLRNQ